MDPLNLLALIIGIIFIISRLPAVIWPSQTARFCNKALDNLYLLRGLGIALAIASIYIIFLVLKKSTPLEITMIAIGVLWLLGGVYIIIKPSLYQRYAKYLTQTSKITFRILSSLLLILGAVMIILAI